MSQQSTKGKTLNVKITDDLIQEATKLLERWAKKKNLLPNGKQLRVTMSIEDSPSVSLKVEDKTSSEKIDEILTRSVETLGLSNRVRTRLKDGGYRIIGDLARTPEYELLKLRCFGKKSLSEIKGKLDELDLGVNMVMPAGPLEQKAILQGSFSRYAAYDLVDPLVAAGVMSVADVLSKSKEEIVSILSVGNRPYTAEGAKQAYHYLCDSLRRRGLTF